jgi:hypothetical protein
VAQEAAQLTRAAVGTAGRCARLAALFALAPAAVAQNHVAEVYRDESLVIGAGLTSGGSRVIHFGDELVLAVRVAFDPARVAVGALDASLFESAWPPAAGPYLASVHAERQTDTGPLPERRLALFRFQILACPESDLPTCPGDRHYAVPEFSLAVEDIGTGTLRHVRFQPVPESLTVMPSIQLDQENQLFPFQVYFPNGGYPQPLAGRDGTRASLATAGIALAFLTGGLLMWPFRKRTDRTAAPAVPRWRRELDALKKTDGSDDARYLDHLRRCLVWYCNDELAIDPFVWLDLAERAEDAGEAAEDDTSLTALRKLFTELLHNPAGRGPELCSRLETLIAKGGTG